MVSFLKTILNLKWRFKMPIVFLEKEDINKLLTLINKYNKKLKALNTSNELELVFELEKLVNYLNNSLEKEF
jgi:hypothetical protein